MQRHLMKKRRFGMYAAICAGMLLYTGCADNEPNVKIETERIEVSEKQESNSENSSGESEDKEDAAKNLVETVHNDTQKDAGKEESDTIDTFTDANDMIKSADLSGTASECSDTGCVMNTSPFADGTSSSGDGGSINVVYSEEAVFQKGTVKSDGSSYSLEYMEKDGIRDHDFVLLFGKHQADGSFLADRIIMISFN